MLVGLAGVALGPGRGQRAGVQAPALQHALAAPAPANPAAAPRAVAPLEQTLSRLVADSGGEAGIHFQELQGPHPIGLQLGADRQFTAASTYKLPLLMAEAAAGPEAQLCFQEEDWEDGPFGDYSEGACYSRLELMTRAGKQSDNTAARILLRDLGGKQTLDAFARQNGARQSSLVDPNLTTAGDLGRLAARAPRSIYPLLTQTENQSGLPAGVPPAVPVAHKDGWYEDAEADVGIVLISPRGPYVLAVCTAGIGGQAGWQLIAAVSRAVWAFESA